MVRWGVLSTARIADKFLEGVAESRTSTVLAVASRDGGRADSYAAGRGIERAYGSYEQLLADPDVDAVYVPLPNALHAQWTRHALEAGKHVLCEKPLSRHPAEVEALFDLADRRGLLLMEAFMWRHSPQTAQLLELVTGGAIGRLRLVRGAFSFALPAERSDDVRFSTELDGGALMDVGCYCVSAARLLAGEPDSVTGRQVTGGTGVDVVFAGTMSFPGGVLASFDCGIEVADRDELEVVGDAGSLFLDDPWHGREPVIELRRDAGVEQITIAPINAYGLEADNFAAAIRGEARPLLGRADALGQARTIEALYASAQAAAA